MRLKLLFLAAALLLGWGGAPDLSAQEAPDPIAVGEMAPDFELPGATRYGILQDPVRLSDYRGDVVVLAFFFRARTRG